MTGDQVLLALWNVAVIAGGAWLIAGWVLAVARWLAGLHTRRGLHQAQAAADAAAEQIAREHHPARGIPRPRGPEDEPGWDDYRSAA